MNKGLDFSGKRVLVTGASHGIGAAVALAFAEAGADLTVLSSSADIKETAREISAKVMRPVAAEICDITDRARVRQVVGALGRLDVLVNNAGLELITPMMEPGDEVEKTFERIIQINVIGTYYVTRDALKLMGPGGKIVITASVWAKSAAPEFAAYITSKHANIGFMRTLARELGPRGINVNAICPGWVKTRAALRSLGEMSKRTGRSENEILEGILDTQALGGLMEPDDVASLYLFLASELANNITGQAYSVDRGEVLS